MGKENSVFALDDKLLEGKDSILSGPGCNLASSSTEEWGRGIVPLARFLRVTVAVFYTE